MNHLILKGTTSRKYKLIRAILRGESRDVVIEGGHPFGSHSFVLAQDYKSYVLRFIVQLGDPSVRTGRVGTFLAHPSNPSRTCADARVIKYDDTFDCKNITTEYDVIESNKD